MFDTKLVDSVVIDAKLDREYHGSILRNCDRQWTENNLMIELTLELNSTNGESKKKVIK
jgi:hypothetical protein